jgi:ATP phosphoribosyltransferase
MKEINIALSKGTLLDPTLKLFKNAGYDISELTKESRKLIIKSKDGFNFLLCRPSDVTTYVEYGAADIGIAGKDVLMESERDFYELADVGFGKCQFVIAVPEKNKDKVMQTYKKLGSLRVATKYTKYCEDYFAAKGIQAEVIKLRGSVELAPMVNLSDVILDLMTTGKTLAQNKLTVIDKGEICTARIIANWVANKLKSTEIQALAGNLVLAAEKLRYI